MAEKALREKLTFKTGDKVFLLDLPEGMEDPFDGVEHMAGTTKGRQPEDAGYDLGLAFVRDQAALANTANLVTRAMVEDGKLWLAYPKKSSRIRTDLSRDEGWEQMVQSGFIVVSIVSVDAQWSAVRFRAKHLVKSLQR